ncbi:purine nucleotide binding protein [Lentinula aff. lateritia]|uniref:Purine nucleotide binding protein n=1 Tax=Lentinula aff. lateritia TaxID=2804960 RepID=A0ACC1UBE1_9AGAR|nr:purine nucleotide binding protein [Lentinula aff. lateritia]
MYMTDDLFTIRHFACKPLSCSANAATHKPTLYDRFEYMAPPKSAKPVQGGKAITAFFKATPNNSQTSQPSSSLEVSKKGISNTSEVPASYSRVVLIYVIQSSSRVRDAIMVDGSDDEPPKLKTKQPRKSALISSSEDETPPNKPAPTPTKLPSNRLVKATARTSLPAKVDIDSGDEVDPRPVKKRKKLSIPISGSEDGGGKMLSPPKKKAAVASGSSSKPKARASLPAKKMMGDDADYEMVSSDEEKKPIAYKTKTKTKVTAKKEISSDGDEPGMKAKAKTPVQRAVKKKLDNDSNRSKGKGKDKPEHQEPKKPNWAALKAAKARGPVAPGSKTVPDGEDNCLLGLSFVFTGELSGFSRDEATDIAKRFGGRVVGQPSSKTNYVILGEDAGPSKLKAIEKHGLKTLDEDQFLDLIATRKGSDKGLDEKTRKKMEKEQDAIKAAAQEMEKKEKKAMKEAESGTGSSKVVDPSTQLWTTRYAPQSLKDVCGNKSAVEKLELWLKEWYIAFVSTVIIIPILFLRPQSCRASFKKPGKNGMNMYRAVLISGSPGIGKTTSAHLCAKLAGYTPIELNASDTRSKKLVENGMNINNKSLDSFIIGGGSVPNPVGTMITDRTCLIMDEVDGMSAGDRGGVGALNALIKKSKIPIICIANDRQAQKLKPLMSTTFNLPFSKPQASMIRSRILSIAYREKMKIPANVIDQLIAGAQSDIRQVLNILSTVKLRSDSLTFDEGKELSKMNEKYTIMSPFDLTSKILGPYLFSHTARETLGDKMELYFQDHSFIPLFIQENYLKTEPAKLRNEQGPEKDLKRLQLMDQAASSISDGDLVDGLIHGPEQHWSLMPLHAVCSTIRPASFIYGTGAHYGGPNSMSFPQWLGQNSKQNKLSRQLGDVQVRMRLKVSGDKNEIRQLYIPALHPFIVRPLVEEGSSAVDHIIHRMDEYYLSKEDWDTVVELGVGEQKDDLILKTIPAATKTTFTRKYNSSEHPIPFHKATDLGKAPKKLAAEQVPDLEEAFDFDEVVEDASDDEKNTKDTEDISHDKLIQTSKKARATGKSKK